MSGHFRPKSTRHFGHIFSIYFFVTINTFWRMTAVYVVKHESGDTGVKGRLGGVANY